MSKRSIYSPKNIRGNGDLEMDSLTVGELQVQGTINADNISLPFLNNGVLSNLLIEECTINSSSIGTETPAPGFFTNLQTGSNSGEGYDVNFYSTILGDYMQWNSATSQLIINGTLLVSGVISSNDGNLILTGNDIMATNQNGGINLVPNGTGQITIHGPLVQNDSYGPVSFNTAGPISLNSNNDELNLYSFKDTNIESDGHIYLKTDIFVDPYNITNIKYVSGHGIEITTEIPHKFLNDDLIYIEGTDCLPSIDGQHNIIGIPATNKVYISGSFLTQTGFSGTIRRIPTHNIYLLPGNYVKMSDEHNFYYGDNIYLKSISGDLHLNLSSSKDLIFDNLNTGISFPNNKRIYSQSSSICLDGGLLLNSGTAKFKSDPAISIGDNILDSKDRGIQFNYLTDKLGFFGYDDQNSRYKLLLNATNNNGVFSGDYANLKLNNLYSNSAQVSEVFGDPDLFLKANRHIYLQAALNETGSIKIAENIQLQFLNGGNLYGSSSNLSIVSGGNINLTPSSDVIIPKTHKLYFNTTTNFNEYVGGTDLGLYIHSDYNTYLDTSAGSIFINQNIPLVFGLSSQNITGSGTELTINSAANINLIPGQNVTVPLLKKIIFGNLSDYIYGNDSLYINSNGIIRASSTSNINLVSSAGKISISCPQDIELSSNSHVLVPINIPISFDNYGNYLKLSSTNDMEFVSGTRDININSARNINFSLTGTDINIPLSKYLYFGIDHSKYIYSNGTTLYVNNNTGSYDINAVTTIIHGDLQVEGTFTKLDTVNITSKDPIITLGESLIDDNKDRGIEYKWNTLGTPKLGFFGVKDSTQRFTYIPDGINNNEVFSGTPGDFDMSKLYCTNIDMQGGNIINLGNVAQVISLTGNPDLTISARYLYLTETAGIVIPSGIPINYGGANTYISGDNTNLSFNSPNFLYNGTGNFTISNVSNINLNSPSINIPTGDKLYFDTNNYITGNNTTGLTLNSSSVNITNLLKLGLDTTFSETLSQLIISSSGNDILLNTDVGKKTIINYLNLGSTGEDIYSDGTNIHINSDTGKIYISPSLDVSGTITSAIWNGGLIGLSYGGTGNNTWEQGSVVFVGNNKLTENNTKFYWDDTNYRLSIGNKTNNFHRLSISGDNACVIPSIETDSQGLLYRNTINKYNIWTYRKSVTGNNAEYIIATGNETLYTNLTPRFIIATNGYVGIGYNNSTNILNPLSVSGNIGLSGLLKFSNTEYISASSGSISINSNDQIKLLAGNNVYINNNIPIIFGTSGNQISYNGSSLSILSNSSISLNPTTSVNILNGKKLTFGNSNQYIYNVGNDLYIDALGSIIIPDYTKLLFSSSNQYISGGDNGILNINSSGETIMSNTGLRNPSNIYFNLLNNNTYIGTDSNENLSLISGNNIYLTSGSGGNIYIPTNSNFVFGDYSTRIVSDGSKLYIYGADLEIDSNVIINGSLNVLGPVISTVQQTIKADGHILQLGNGMKLDILNITDGSIVDSIDITVSADHKLIVGDTIIISETNSSPVIDGTYTVTEIIDNITYRINFTGGVLVDGTLGLSVSKKVYNNGKDIGIQANWHNGISGTLGAKYAFFGYKTSLGRWQFIKDGINNNEVFTGTLGDIECSKVFCSNISGFTLDGNLSGNNNLISGNNFNISGGIINNTNIGLINPAKGTFTDLNSNNVNLTGGNIDNITIGYSTRADGYFNSLYVNSTDLVTNLNSEYLNGLLSTDFVWRDGTKSLTADWAAGNFDIKSNTLTSPTLIENGIVYSNNVGTLMNNSDMIYDPLTRLVSIYSGSFNNLEATSGNLSGINITLLTGNTLDCSSGTVIFANNQLSGDWISGGTADIDISGNAFTVTNGIYKTNFLHDNTILKADVANNPIELQVPENTVIGRKIGGVITALTESDLNEMFSFSSGGGDIDPALLADLMLKSGSNMTGPLGYSYEEISVAGGSSITLNMSKNISYITITGNGIATCNFSPGTVTGQWKNVICMLVNTSSELQITCTDGMIQLPGSNVTEKVLRFTESGMSLKFIWNNTLSRWFLDNSGCLLN